MCVLIYTIAACVTLSTIIYLTHWEEIYEFLVSNAEVEVFVMIIYSVNFKIALPRNIWVECWNPELSPENTEM